MEDKTLEIIGLGEKAYNVVAPLAIEYGMKLLAALVIFFIGRIIIKVVISLVDKMLTRSGVDGAVKSFVHNLVYSGLMIFVILAVLSKLGIQTASFIAVIGAAGLAIGLALQGSLSNFASGVLLILFRQFKEGDYVEAGGTAGTVEKINIFSTQMKTPDNKRVIVPNSNITESNIINYSANPIRRVDFTLGVSYSSDLKKTRAVIQACLDERPEILVENGITIAVAALADSSVNFVVRVWVNTADYWPVHFALNEAFKEALDAAGISIPFPQMDVHLDPVKLKQIS